MHEMVAGKKSGGQSAVTDTRRLGEKMLNTF
jgi:hypothetical protein